MLVRDTSLREALSRKRLNCLPFLARAQQIIIMIGKKQHDILNLYYTLQSDSKNRSDVN